MVDKEEFKDLKSRVRSNINAANKIATKWSSVADQTIADHNQRYEGSIDENKAARSFVLQDADGVEEKGRIDSVLKTLEGIQSTLGGTSASKLSEESFDNLVADVEYCESEIDDLAV
jgi:hypothetical protein